jgi:septum formation protein
MQKIVLASQSPRRKQLLEWAEVEFDIMAMETEETWPEGMAIEVIPIHIARQKADAIMRQEIFKRYEQHVPVLAADTIVVLQDQVIGKPTDREDAIRMLTALQGNTHRVITGVVIRNHLKEITFADITEVDFHPIDAADIIYYVDQYKPYDKAGSYAIQEWIGVIGIKAVRGDFYNVMGLPVSRVVRALHDHF